MTDIGQIERITQDRVIELFQKVLGYRYIGNLEDEDNGNIREDDLINYLKSTGKYSDTLINRAISDFKKTAEINYNDDLYQANKEVYSNLRYGVKVREEAGENKETIELINWENPSANDFAIAE